MRWCQVLLSEHNTWLTVYLAGLPDLPETGLKDTDDCGWLFCFFVVVAAAVDVFSLDFPVKYMFRYTQQQQQKLFQPLPKPF